MSEASPGAPAAGAGASHLGPGGIGIRLGRFVPLLGRLLLQPRDAALLRRLQAVFRGGEAGGGPRTDLAAERLRLFERASAAARIGFWECRLPDERLDWSGGTYDIFDLPHGHRVERRDALEFYTRGSLQTLQARRSDAIANGSGFVLDTELTTARGARRVMRITATVDCEGGRPIRIFGLKQEITEERLLLERTRRLAERDAMTGLSNRVRFEAELAALCDACAVSSSPGALLLVDLDGFKEINDTYGHAAGDDCLVEAARRLERVSRGMGSVARIGGDEFAVIVPPEGAVGAEELAARIVVAMAEPVRRGQSELAFGASVGVALAEACTSEELFARADAALYAAKGAGRGTFRTSRASPPWPPQ
ncbi:GGDEF domain-containing protein [Lutibaculum baratangense]|uniref:Diguanylate cyclase (GGDEF domain) n=1 Tax=Lutibaculum baratangense AMV1 TaxID=631454 RepID=V4THP0_9HYPH|nr:GGDEF domain-containing protein [Lutibaculum baratangense]ESR25548.1 diguanylate cyclase (GGDEF domain) [Lutibaculum baratangense AMV1]